MTVLFDRPLRVLPEKRKPHAIIRTDEPHRYIIKNYNLLIIFYHSRRTAFRQSLVEILSVQGKNIFLITAIPR